MILKQLEKKLHNDIPLTKFMNISLLSYDELSLKATAPLQVNKNDKNTAFGGSLATITIICGWSICWLICKELGFKNFSIVIIKNTHTYRKPVTKNINCHTLKPSQKDIILLKEKLIEKSSGSLKIESSIIENNETCVEFSGLYVIKISK